MGKSRRRGRLLPTATGASSAASVAEPGRGHRALRGRRGHRTCSLGRQTKRWGQARRSAAFVPSRLEPSGDRTRWHWQCRTLGCRSADELGAASPSTPVVARFGFSWTRLVPIGSLERGEVAGHMRNMNPADHGRRPPTRTRGVRKPGAVRSCVRPDAFAVCTRLALAAVTPAASRDRVGFPPPQRSRRPPVVASEEVISEFNTNASEGHRTPCELAIGSESFHRLVLIRGALSRATNDGARPVDDFWVVFNGPRGTQEGAGGGGGKASPCMRGDAASMSVRRSPSES
jgi:hypothetical protein